MKKNGVWVLVAACLLAAGGSAAVAQPAGAQPAPAEAVRGLSLARQGVQDAQAQLRAAEAARSLAHQAAEDAHNTLLTASEKPGNDLAVASTAAHDRQQALVDADAKREAATQQLAQARRTLVQVTADYTSCGSAAGSPCQALRLAQARPAATPASVPTNPAKPDAILALLEQAKGALASAKKIGAQSAAAFAEGDSTVTSLLTQLHDARKSALNPSITPSEREAAGKKVAELAQLLREAESAFEQSFEAYRARGNAQQLANRLVAEALLMADCPLAQPCTNADDGRLQRAQQAADALKQRAEASEKALKATQAAAVHVGVGIEYPLEKREQAALFKALLKSVPDARSLVGGDAFRLSASSSGPQATIRLDLDRNVNDVLRDTALIISTPAAKEGRTTFYASADGLSNATFLQLARTLQRGVPGKDATLDLLYQFGVNARLGQTRHEWQEADTLGNTLSATRTPWSLGVHAALAGLKSRNLHLFRVDLNNAYKDQKTRVVCPAAPPVGRVNVDCVQATFGAPKRATERLWSYEYRYQSKHGFALAPSIQYNDVTGVKEINVPLYLLHAPDAKRAFTGGINWNRTSRSHDPESKSRSQFGVFVGAPFTLLEGAGP